MKRFLAYALLLGFLSACDNENDISNKLEGIPEDVQISDSKARNMIRYKKCTDGKCIDTKYITPRVSDVEQIMKALSLKHKIIDTVFLDARYRVEDEKRYKKINGIQGKDAGKGDVGNYTTKVLRVTTDDAEDHYFDVVTICPPPPGCNKE